MITASNKLKSFQLGVSGDLEAAKTRAQKDLGKPDAAVEKAARDFESYFVGSIFEEAFSSIEKSELSEGGLGDDVYQSMFVQEMAKKASSTGAGFGLARQLVREIQQRQGGQGLVSEDGLKNYLEGAQTPQDTEGKPGLSGPGGSGVLGGLTSQTYNLPEEGKITSTFGLRKDPFHGQLRHHDGIDIAMPYGTPIRAAFDGIVETSGNMGGYGKAIVINHDKGYATVYGHNSRNLVGEGEKVSKGQIIGFSGNSGRSTGPHLHFEVRSDGKAVDPQSLLAIKANDTKGLDSVKKIV